mmetsp:Transcript_101062/g.283304  ORF Transcript_101062/g.283304 Transcript_101062/m.283304 type:complete len:471 (+) Transcript_101062:402-1814(+)
MRGLGARWLVSGLGEQVVLLDVPPPHLVDRHCRGHHHAAAAGVCVPGEEHAGRGEGLEGHPRDQHLLDDARGDCLVEVLLAGVVLHGRGLRGGAVVVLRDVDYVGPLVRPGYRLRDGVLHLAQLRAGARDRGDTEAVRGHGHHLRPRIGLLVLHRARALLGAHHPHRSQLVRHVRSGLGRLGNVGHDDDGVDHRCLRSHLGQRRRHRGDGGLARDGARLDGLLGCRRQHHGGHRQGLRHRLRCLGQPGALRRVYRAGEGVERGHPQPVGLHGAALRRDDALCLRGLDYEVCGYGGERHGEGVLVAVPEDHGAGEDDPGLRALHPDLDRGVLEGDVGAWRAGDSEPPRRRPGLWKERMRGLAVRCLGVERAAGHLHEQHRRGVGQLEEVHLGRRIGQGVCEGLGGAQELCDGRHGGRPAEGHLGSGLEHRHEVDGHHQLGLRQRDQRLFLAERRALLVAVRAGLRVLLARF